MINIKPNQILKHKKYAYKHKVLEVFTKSAILQGETSMSIPYVMTFEQIERYFELPKERWKPEIGEKYFYPVILSEWKYKFKYWTGLSFPDEILGYERGLVCKTQEEAIALADKMLKAINE